MPTMDVAVRRISVVSQRPFEEIVRRLTATIGRPDMTAFHNAVAAATTVAELESVVHEAIGGSDLMEFVRFDSGDVLRKERGGQGPKMLRLVVGNPLIMKEMAKAVPDAASYAPVTILIDERADGVHLSYDLMASLLAPYGGEGALVVARDLDTKVETLLEAVARRPLSRSSGSRAAWPDRDPYTRSMEGPMMTRTRLRRSVSFLIAMLHATVPPKVEYRLTQWGQSPCPALDQLMTWTEQQPTPRDVRQR